MRRPVAVGLLALGLAAAGCKHPMQKALERGDYAGACRAWWDDPGAHRLDDAVSAPLDDWLRRGTTLRLRLEVLNASALGEGLPGLDELVFDGEPQLYRVSMALEGAPPGTVVEVEPPALALGHELVQLAPRADAAPTAERLAIFVKTPERPALEPIPPQYLPSQYVEETLPGKFRYRTEWDPQSVAFAVMSGGLSLVFAPPQQVAFPVPETAAEKKKRAAHEKAQAQAKAAHDEAERKRVEASRGAMEAIVATNRERLAAHEAMLARRQVFLEQWARALEPTCPLTEGGRITLAPGQTCAFVNWGKWAKETVPGSSWHVGTRVQYEFSAATPPCPWTLEDRLALPGASASEWPRAVNARFAGGPVRLELKLAPAAR
ncbi:MAG: hypothetical protein AB1730_18275 [Myxococcota bacterium]